MPFHYREVMATGKIRRADTASELAYAAKQLTPAELGRVFKLLEKNDTGVTPNSLLVCNTSCKMGTLLNCVV